MRSAVVIGQVEGGWSAYFGDLRANVYAVDARTGDLRWKTRIDDYPGARVTGSPTLVGTTLFVPVSSAEEITTNEPDYACCSFRGSIVAWPFRRGRGVSRSRQPGGEQLDERPAQP